MKQLTQKSAVNFLMKYFSLFVNNYINNGYKVRIILPENSLSSEDYFYVQFCKGDEHTRNYKIIYQ
jgi:hypothetical protein